MRRLHPGPKCGFTVGLALALLGGLPALAANECRVEYGYHTGGGFSRQDHAPQVSLNAGEARSFNQGQMNYVRNLGANKVKVKLAGVLLTDLTLEKNQRDPGVGFYLEQGATLKRIECLAQASAGFGTPEQLIESLKATVPLEEIARQLKAQFRKTETEIARLLKPHFTPQQVMAALKAAFNAPLQQVAQWMKAAGYAAEQIARALSDAGVSPERIVNILMVLGYTVLVVVVIVVSLPVFVLGLGGTVLPSVAACVVLATTLIAGGFSIPDAAKAIKHVGGNEVTIASVLKQLPAPPAQIRSILASLGYSADQILKALQAAGFTAEQIGGAPPAPRAAPLPAKGPARRP